MFIYIYRYISSQYPSSKLTKNIWKIGCPLARLPPIHPPERQAKQDPWSQATSLCNSCNCKQKRTMVLQAVLWANDHMYHIYIWIIYHPSLLPSKLWGSCCSHIFCIGQETSQTEPLPKGGQSIDVQTLMKKARPWHLFRHFSTKRPTPAPNRPQPTKKSIPFRFRTGAALGLVPLFWASLPAKPSGRW